MSLDLEIDDSQREQYPANVHFLINFAGCCLTWVDDNFLKFRSGFTFFYFAGQEGVQIIPQFLFSFFGLVN